ncbi:LON peptidase N-terminal domain and RING finger protein 3 [Erysiphe necator]|uniref:Putative atp-dependent protease la domain-containing protein n=1 Tax=Uncinula necator TaxID=52586 RepID=A0A0B1P552_UNCNE|nr:LON peptidase N-terminal domain and RING finger protein 3 [Erysiphe necator]KHJ32480.1 putative atp-dependent protease la domain-containing protein [Erysiphe necator]
MSSLPLSSTHTLPHRASLRQVSSASAQEINFHDDPPDPFRDVRNILRIAECPQCSNPLQSPTTLPCGNSLCMRCIPKLHVRQNITYSSAPNRLQGFLCSFSSCEIEHAIGDCNKDVTLNKIMNAVRLELGGAKEHQTGNLDVCLKLQERDSRHRSVALQNTGDRSKAHSNGRLFATHSRYDIAKLPHESDFDYSNSSLDIENLNRRNNSILLRLKEAIRSELDCQICYGIFVDPYITTCGHTFCLKCLEKVFEHSKLCPICRSSQTRTTSQKASIAPSRLLAKLIQGLYPENAAMRIFPVQNEEVCNDDMKVPLFICTPSFPSMPTFLHIFEPRYRLMIRRVMETSERKFGMLLHNQSRESQGNLGSVGFYEYGTMLHIVNMHRLPNGHILIETIGVSRFRVVKYGIKDEYTIGKIEPVDDISVSDEEALEARETLQSRSISVKSDATTEESSYNSSQQTYYRPEAMSTQALLEVGVDFVKRMQEQSAPWLQTRVFQAYGKCPQDPDFFPWWFASVLPISDMQKYELLSTESVRDRLKICVRWVKEIEHQSDNNLDSNCGVF